ncbi:MAG: hypothetical protein ABI594_16865 [Ginsengibacter sp.]
MANLHVQPKRKNYAWLWILILIVIIACLAYYFMIYKKQVPAPGDASMKDSTMRWEAPLQNAANNTMTLS